MSDLGGGLGGFQTNPMPLRAPDDGRHKSGSAQQGSWITPGPKTTRAPRSRALAITVVAVVAAALILLALLLG